MAEKDKGNPLDVLKNLEKLPAAAEALPTSKHGDFHQPKPGERWLGIYRKSEKADTKGKYVHTFIARDGDNLTVRKLKTSRELKNITLNMLAGQPYWLHFGEDKKWKAYPVQGHKYES